MSTAVEAGAEAAEGDAATAASAVPKVIKLPEKLGYAAGDAASVLFFRTFASYLMFFCTDIVGLAAASIGTMLWVTRIFDAVNDPMMGAVCDRTKSRHGRFRPWLRWIAVPLAVSGVAIFAVPDWSQGAKLAYVYVTYTLMMVLYTAINIPYGALMGVMTPNSEERTALASFRFYGAYGADFVVKSTILYLVVFLGGPGGGEAGTQSGYVWTMALYAVAAIALFQFTFFSTKERVEPPAGQETNLVKDLSQLVKNKPWLWIIVMGVTTIPWIAMRDAALLYYVRYYVIDDANGSNQFASLGTTLPLTGQLGALGGVALTGIFTRMFGGKKNTYVSLTVLAALVGFLFYAAQPGQLWFIYTVYFVVQLLSAPLMPLFWSMIADTADYSEWKFGRRFTGLTFSAGTFSQKLGWALGPAAAGYLLAFYGYQANVAQTPEAIAGLRAMMSWIPSLIGLFGAGIAMMYGINRKVEARIAADLHARKISREAAPS